MSTKHYRTVVVGTDGSELAEPTVERAARMAARDEGELVIVCAWSDLGGRDDAKSRASVSGVANIGRVKGRAAASEAIARATAVAMDAGATIAAALLVDGEPAQALLQTAEEHSADLLVLGAIRDVSIAERLLGTTAGHVVRNASCDVLLVRPVPIAGQQEPGQVRQELPVPESDS